jgi:acetyl-CoA acetyltransferase
MRYILPAARWGGCMGDAALVDYMVGILHDRWQKTPMGITAENVAERYGISREMQARASARLRLSMIAPISVLMLADRGSNFMEPM